MLLGRLDEVDYWALGIDLEGSDDPPGETLRTVGSLLPAGDAGLAVAAVSLLGWHRSAMFCPRCGLPNLPDLPGHSRTCPQGHQEFPRTDPAVIVLVHDGQGNAALGRQPVWPKGRMSVFAGFVEGGESLEATVVREISEEIGVLVSDVTYLGSQPWPFPRSLMIGFAALTEPGVPLRPRDGEIEDAQWFSRDQLREILAGENPYGVLLPDSVSIARRMIEGYVAAG